MKIDYSDKTPKYYDINNRQIKEGDVVLLEGKQKKVYLSEEGHLGTDATNPAWIKNGIAFECEYGIYPFLEDDEPEIISVWECILGGITDVIFSS